MTPNEFKKEVQDQMRRHRNYTDYQYCAALQKNFRNSAACSPFTELVLS